MPESPPPRLLLRSVAVSQGYTDAELARMVRRKQLRQLQRGAYLERPPESPEDRHRAVITATVAGLRVPGVVSHGSAALLQGLPLWQLPVARVHLIRQPPAAGSGTRRTHLHIARLPDDEVVCVGTIPVTGITRTVVDIARSASFESAVVTADAALARKTTTRDRLSDCLQRMGAVPGSRQAARVLAFADGRSGSVGESRSRVLMQRLGLPAPELQLEVRRANGSLIGRADFGWEEFGTLGEFDGRVKYGRLLRPGQSAGDAVYEEKLREDAMRGLGWEMARWTWPELDRAAIVADRLQRAFARGHRRP